MKSKQEVIQEAWGETVYPGLDMDMKSWDEQGDGWYKHWKETGKVYRNFLNDNNKRIIDLRDDIINLNGWFWPKSLDGIENNRGWTRIESESDLPKENMVFMECITKLGYQATHHFMIGDEKYMVEKYSHYKPMPFNPPIY